MIQKTKISPRVIWLEDDRSSSAPRVRANGKTSNGNTNAGTSCFSNGNAAQKACTATPFSNGYDEVSLYCYNNIIINNRYRRSAYVACDYVE